MMSIRRGLLSGLFEGVVAKQLTLVETITPNSNQHEFQGTKPLKQLFGEQDRKRIPARFIWLAEEQEGLSEDGIISWSNVRKGKPRAPEYHLYYSGNSVTEAMKPGDTLFLALRPNGAAMVIIAPAASTMQSQLLWLFGLSEQASPSFQFRDITADEPAKLDFAARYILDELGIDVEEAEADRLDELLEKFDMEFPATRTFSEFARSTLPHVNAGDNPDQVIMAWIEQEERLFRRLERHIVGERLRSGFMAGHGADVEGFMSFSLSIQNRRKSRAGRSLEHHLETLFLAHGVRFNRSVETENRNKPDFLFPGQKEYRDDSFPPERLTMLGAKSTLKDRWRQVLAEARRIVQKHLLTLEPGISEAQTNQMLGEGLQLIVPAPIQSTYRDSQKAWLMSLEQFIALVKGRQANGKAV